MISLITTFFGAGKLRPAPGTWGSLAGVIAGCALAIAVPPILFLLATLAVFFIGWWATAEATRGQENHDPSEIVIDEVAGQWIALLPVVFGAAYANADLLRLWPGILTAFLAFRAFDILKPGPVGWADRMHSPLGVMLDDVIAGALAALVVALLAAIAHIPILT